MTFLWFKRKKTIFSTLQKPHRDIIFILSASMWFKPDLRKFCFSTNPKYQENDSNQ